MYWQPTHRLTLDDGSVIDVMAVVIEDVDEPGWLGAYTKAEWEVYDNADYTVSPEGDWLCQGRPFAGTVDRIQPV